VFPANPLSMMIGAVGIVSIGIHIASRKRELSNIHELLTMVKTGVK